MMTIIDLTKKESTLHKVISFPDGQQDVVITGHIKKTEEVLIQSRFNSFKDLEVIICAANALRRLGVKERNLYIPYLLGARSDREFQTGGNSYLVDIIAPQLNQIVTETDGQIKSLFSSIIVMDVHSDVAAACIKNLKSISNEDLVKWALGEIYDYDSNHGNSNMILVSPDGGALKKIYKLADSFEYTGDVICCSKYRNTKGELSNVNVPYDREHHWNKDVIIIDDICDGGKTFINIAKEIKKWQKEEVDIYKNDNKNLYLIVTHGIFSKGVDELSEYFDAIFCTNSYSNVNHKSVKQLNIF